MKLAITLVGSRYFGATVFETLHKEGFDIAQVVAPALPFAALHDIHGCLGYEAGARTR